MRCSQCTSWEARRTQQEGVRRTEVGASATLTSCRHTLVLSYEAGMSWGTLLPVASSVIIKKRKEISSYWWIGQQRGVHPHSGPYSVTWRNRKCMSPGKRSQFKELSPWHHSSDILVDKKPRRRKWTSGCQAGAGDRSHLQKDTRESYDNGFILCLNFGDNHMTLNCQNSQYCELKGVNFPMQIIA